MSLPVNCTSVVIDITAKFSPVFSKEEEEGSTSRNQIYQMKVVEPQYSHHEVFGLVNWLKFMVS